MTFDGRAYIANRVFCYGPVFDVSKRLELFKHLCLYRKEVDHFVFVSFLCCDAPAKIHQSAALAIGRFSRVAKFIDFASKRFVLLELFCEYLREPAAYVEGFNVPQFPVFEGIDVFYFRARSGEGVEVVLVVEAEALVPYNPKFYSDLPFLARTLAAL